MAHVWRSEHSSQESLFSFYPRFQKVLFMCQSHLAGSLPGLSQCLSNDCFRGGKVGTKLGDGSPRGHRVVVTSKCGPGLVYWFLYILLK